MVFYDINFEQFFYLILFIFFMPKEAKESSHSNTPDETVTINIMPLITPIALLISALMISISIFVSINKLGTQLASGIKTGDSVAEGNADNKPNDVAVDPAQQADNTKVSTKIDDDAIKGNKNKAKVGIVEFSDYECPFCKRFYTDTLPQITKEFIDTDKAIFVYRDLPLDALHPNARNSAEAAECAGEESPAKYLEFHNKIFETSDELSATKLKDIAKEIGLNTGKFNDCFDSKKMADEVKKDESDAAAAGINGTPGFVVGTLKSDGTVEGEVISGALPFSEFQKVIDKYLQ